MVKATITTAFLWWVSPALAQYDSSALWIKYEREVIYFSGSRYIKGDDLYLIRDLKNEFQYSPLGKEVFRMSRTDRRISLAFTISSLISYVALLQSFQYNKGNQAQTTLVVTTALLSGSIYFSIRGDKRMKKAVWIRNRDMLLKK